MKKRKIIAALVLLTAVGSMIYAGSQLARAEQIYQEGETAYDVLKEHAKKSSLTEDAAPLLEIDFEALKTIEIDAAAWLYSPDTAIDYPVMKANDYDYYLHHLPDGTSNANGSLFIDYNCAPDFSDPLTVIYGHNMKSKKMFSSLTGYKSQKYYDEHPIMYLYTQQGNYRIELLYGCVIGAGQWRERAFMYKENIDALLAYSAHNTTFESSAVYENGDRIVTMSTCSYEFDNARYVVVGILRSY
jgi:sortase B